MRLAYSYKLTGPQYARALVRRSGAAFDPWSRRVLFVVAVLAWLPLGVLVGLSYGHRSVPGAVVLWAALLVIGLTLVAHSVRHALLRRALAQSPSVAGVARTLTVQESGIRQSDDHTDLFHPWCSYTAVRLSHDFVYLELDRVHFQVVPASMFDSIAERDEFIGYVRARIAEQGGSAALVTVTEPPEAPADAPAAPRERVSALRLALDAIRLATFRDVPAARLATGWATILVVAVITIAVPFAASVPTVGLDGEWSWYTLPSALVHIPLILAAAIVAAYALGRRGDIARLFLAGLLISLVVDLAWIASSAALSGARSLSWQWEYMAIPAAWLAIAMATYACRSVDPGGRRAAVLVCCIVLVGLPLGTIYRDRSMWHVPYKRGDDARSTAFGPASEDAFYKQPELLARELAAVRPRREGKVNVFVIGMAGYGNQDVFQREVTSVADLFRTRFGAEGHVVRLVNNRNTLLELPIASKTSLREAVARVAQVMDKDQDVLVLFMTSHGSEDHRFSLQLWPMRFHDIDPATVRAILDESGVKNRVVIVSSCYSGGYVNALAGPDSLVITAAAADRTSFGCSNEAQWTYFGKAYFDEALRTTHSFTDAFEAARPVIEQREKQQGFDPSQPQMSVGSRIKGKLSELQAELDGKKSAARR